MALTLFHGPAGAGKTNAIIKELSSQSANSFKVIFPDSLLIEEYQQNWLQLQSGQGALLNNTFLLYDHFLLALLKLNEPRVHFVGMLFVRNVIRKIIHNSKSPTFKKYIQFPNLMNELAYSLVKLGQCGLNAYRAGLYFKNIPEMKPIINLLHEYENIMASHHAYDSGLLTVALLELMEQDHFKWFDQTTTLVIDRFFPLQPGARELFYRLSQKVKNLNVIISYSIDYAKVDNAHLYYSYTQLGELATRQEHFNLTKKATPITAQLFSNPADELHLVAHQIKELLTHQVDPKAITIILPVLDTYHERLHYLLHNLEIPFSDTHNFKLGKFSSNTSAQEIIPQWLEYNSLGTQYLLGALSTAQIFEEEWEFVVGKLFDATINQPLITGWYQHEKENHSFNLKAKNEGVKILSLTQACLMDTQYLFVAGFSGESLLSGLQDFNLLPSDILGQPEMIETFGNARYKLECIQKNWDDLINRNQTQIRISYSQFDWGGKEQTPPDLFFNEQGIKYQLKLQTDDKEIDDAKARIYPVKKQSTFSITEIETYLKCPFQYYAKHHLKLEEPDEESVDVRGDISGRLIHRVLDKLYGENQDLFLEACDYDLYLKRFKDLIPTLIKNLALDDSHLKKSPAVIQADYIKRATESILGLVDLETGFIRNGTKLTKPHAFEWAFGKGKVPPLKISRDQQEVFITGRIDRIDVDRKNKVFSVIDYKTGELPTGASIKEGLSPQVPLYLMVVKQILFPDFSPSSGMLLGLKEIGKNVGLVFDGLGEDKLLWRTSKITLEEWDDLTLKIENSIIEMTSKINEGHFHPKPLSKTECDRCGYVALCQYKAEE
ncbi:MAG: ATP-dependent nuclease subunit B-like protein [uncultured bacterium]|nr:MAG: ATP-dependent nuclease subunit B-like protein [uncultured bacterium]